MIGAEVNKGIPYVEAERVANPKERELWNKAQAIARRVSLKSYALKLQWKQIKLTHEFAVANKVNPETCFSGYFQPCCPPQTGCSSWLRKKARSSEQDSRGKNRRPWR